MAVVYVRIYSPSDRELSERREVLVRYPAKASLSKATLDREIGWLPLAGAAAFTFKE